MASKAWTMSPLSSKGMAKSATQTPRRLHTEASSVKKKNLTHSIELQRVSPYSAVIASKDSHPPAAEHLSDSVASHGSRLRVAYQAVESWLVDRAVLPIENSLGGSIHRNYDLLLRYGLHIVGEVTLSVRHCLLANHGVKIEDLKRVVSHPQALAQCENTLTKFGVVREAADDTAGSAQTSVVFSLEEGPGALFKALGVFAMRNINLTKIESRPLRKKLLRVHDSSNGSPKYFDYLFYVDFEASMADENAQNALRHLKLEIATFCRVLGSYPVDMSEAGTT